MNLLQAFLADRDKLRLIVRRTARLGIPLDAPWPQDVLFTMTHTVYLTLQFLIAVHWVHADEAVIVLDRGKTMLTTIFSILGRSYQMAEHGPLQLLALGLVLLKFPHSRGEDMSY